MGVCLLSVVVVCWGMIFVLVGIVLMVVIVGFGWEVWMVVVVWVVVGVGMGLMSLCSSVFMLVFLMLEI